MIARNSFIIMVSQATSALLGILALTMISKLWGGYAPAMMGVIWFGMAFVGSFSFITNMGFDATHIKKVSEGKDLGTCMGSFIAIKLILIGIMISAVVGSIAVWKHIFNKGFYDATTETVVYIFLGYSVLFALSQIGVTTFNSQKKNVKSQLSMFMEPLVRVTLVITVALAGITGAIVTYQGATTTVNLEPRYPWPAFLEPVRALLAAHPLGAMAMAYMLGAFAAFCMALFLLRKYPIARPTKEYMRSYLLFAIPLMIPIIFTLLIANIDKVMLGYFWTPAEVGYYASVYRIAAMMMMISGAIGVVVFPTISAIHACKGVLMNKKCRQIARVTKNSERYVSMVTVPFIIMIVVFAVPIIDILLNSSFRPASVSFRLLAVYTYLHTLAVPYMYLVIGMNRPKQNAKVVALSGIVNIVLNILFIPRGGILSGLGISGINGAACSILISTTIMLAGLHYYSRKIVRRRLFQPKILLHLIAGAVMGAAMFSVGTFIEPIRWFHLGGLFAMGLAVYLSVLRCAGEFRRTDLYFFLDTMSIRKLFRHVKNELGREPDSEK